LQSPSREQGGCSPHAPKAWLVFHALLDLEAAPWASPLEIASLTGVVQWFNMLNRSLLSALRDVYVFSRLEPQHAPRDVPLEVVAELALNIALFPFWEVDRRREWLPALLATDASPSFGFGVSIAGCSVDLSRQAASIGPPHLGHARFITESDDPPEKPRRGTAVRLGLRQRDFRTVLSVNAQHKAHSGTLEADGLYLGLRWLGRAVGRHNRRVAVLVDAVAVLGADKKGRSSAGSLHRSVARCAALTLARGWVLHFAYVTSKSNPADAPSRGVQRRRLAAPAKNTVIKTRGGWRGGSGQVF